MSGEKKKSFNELFKQTNNWMGNT